MYRHLAFYYVAILFNYTVSIFMIFSEQNYSNVNGMEDLPKEKSTKESSKLANEFPIYSRVNKKSKRLTPQHSIPESSCTDKQKIPTDPEVTYIQPYFPPATVGANESSNQLNLLDTTASTSSYQLTYIQPYFPSAAIETDKSFKPSSTSNATAIVQQSVSQYSLREEVTNDNNSQVTPLQSVLPASHSQPQFIADFEAEESKDCALTSPPPTPPTRHSSIVSSHIHQKLANNWKFDHLKHEILSVVDSDKTVYTDIPFTKQGNNLQSSKPNFTDTTTTGQDVVLTQNYDSLEIVPEPPKRVSSRAHCKSFLPKSCDKYITTQLEHNEQDCKDNSKCIETGVDIDKQKKALITASSDSIGLLHQPTLLDSVSATKKPTETSGFVCDKDVDYKLSICQDADLYDISIQPKISYSELINSVYSTTSSSHLDTDHESGSSIASDTADDEKAPLQLPLTTSQQPSVRPKVRRVHHTKSPRLTSVDGIAVKSAAFSGCLDSTSTSVVEGNINNTSNHSLPPFSQLDLAFIPEKLVCDEECGVDLLVNRKKTDGADHQFILENKDCDIIPTVITRELLVENSAAQIVASSSAQTISNTKSLVSSSGCEPISGGTQTASKVARASGIDFVVKGRNHSNAGSLARGLRKKILCKVCKSFLPSVSGGFTTSQCCCNTQEARAEEGPYEVATQQSSQVASYLANACGLLY